MWLLRMCRSDLLLRLVCCGIAPYRVEAIGGPSDGGLPQLSQGRPQFMGVGRVGLIALLSFVFGVDVGVMGL